MSVLRARQGMRCDLFIAFRPRRCDRDEIQIVVYPEQVATDKAQDPLRLAVRTGKPPG
jgi:hypothetical protein